MSVRLGDPNRHFFMTRSVARVMGLNLYEEVQCGALDSTEYARMVTRCRACPLVEACEEWLSHGVAQTANPPPGCMNADALSALKRSP